MSLLYYPCSKQICQKNFDYRHYDCFEPDDCSCSCQESKSKTFWKGFSSVALGVTAFAGGTVLTAVTAGAGLGVAATIAAVSACGTLASAGATAAIQPVIKQMSGECMTGADYGKDILIGGAIGAVTGPIGFGGAASAMNVTDQF